MRIFLELGCHEHQNVYRPDVQLHHQHRWKREREHFFEQHFIEAFAHFESLPVILPCLSALQHQKKYRNSEAESKCFSYRKADKTKYID